MTFLSLSTPHPDLPLRICFDWICRPVYQVFAISRRRWRKEAFSFIHRSRLFKHVSLSLSRSLCFEEKPPYHWGILRLLPLFDFMELSGVWDTYLLYTP